MSTDLGTVVGRNDTHPWLQGPGLRDEIHVNRFWGVGEDGTCVQLTIDDRFVQLDAAGVTALLEILDAA